MSTAIRYLLLLCASSGFLTGLAPAQDSGTAAAGAKPTEHILGTITATDPAAHTITVKQDSTGTAYVVGIGNTRTLFRVQPGAKDLKSAVRITDSDFAPGDRVDVRAFKGDQADELSARSVVLMSARDLQQHQQEELAAWQNSTVGTVTTVSPTGDTIAMTSRTPEGRKSTTVHVTPSTQFTRYSPENPKTAAPSKIGDIQPGDQLHVLGDQSAEGDAITAQKIYSAPTRTIAGTVVSVAPDGKQIVVRNLQTKQPVTVDIGEASSVKKLPQEMAAMMAARFRGSANSGGASGGQAGPPRAPEGQTPMAGNGAGAPNAAPGGMRRGGGDLNRMLQRLPSITVSELKPGAAVVVWGMQGRDPGSISANTVLAGVEPVLQSAAPRQNQSLNSDWGLDMSVPE